MPPEQRFVPRFAAEPPQEEVPYGRWAKRLAEEFLAAAPRQADDGAELGAPQQIVWYSERNPDGQLDLCDEVIGAWRGQAGAVASMTLVWGHPLVSGGRVATAELAG